MVWQNWGPLTVGHLAPAARDLGRRLPVRHRRAHAQHRGRPGRRGLRRGGGLAGQQRPAGGHPGGRSWAGWRRARWSRCTAAARPSAPARPTCASSAPRRILRTGIWGERLEIQRQGRKRLRTVHVPAFARRVGAVPGRARRARSPTPARRKWACAWRGCGMRSRRRRRRTARRCAALEIRLRWT